MVEPRTTGRTPTRAWFAVPTGLFLLVGALLPLAVLLVFSFFRTEDMTLVPALSMRSWQEMAGDPLYARLIGRSLGYGLATAALTALFGYPLAIGLWRLPLAWKGAATVVLLTPLYTGELMRLYAWRLILGAQGMLNSLLMWLGIIHAPLKGLLFSPFATHLVLFYDELPFMVLALWVSIERINHHLVEAARDLGATPVQTFTRLILPMTVPGLAAGGFAVLALAAGDLLTPNLVGGTSGTTAMSMIDSLFGTAFDWPLASALALALLATLLGSLVLLGFLISRWPTVRAVLKAGAR